MSTFSPTKSANVFSRFSYSKGPAKFKCCFLSEIGAHSQEWTVPSIRVLVMWLNVHFSRHTPRCKQLKVNPFFLQPTDVNVRMNRRLRKPREEIYRDGVFALKQNKPVCMCSRCTLIEKVVVPQKC